MAGERPPPVAAKRRRGVTWTGTKPRHLSASFYSTHMGMVGAGAPAHRNGRGGDDGGQRTKAGKKDQSRLLLQLWVVPGAPVATRTSAYHTCSSAPPTAGVGPRAPRRAAERYRIPACVIGRDRRAVPAGKFNWRATSTCACGHADADTPRAQGGRGAEENRPRDVSLLGRTSAAVWVWDLLLPIFVGVWRYAH